MTLQQVIGTELKCCAEMVDQILEYVFYPYVLSISVHMDKFRYCLDTKSHIISNVKKIMSKVIEKIIPLHAKQIVSIEDTFVLVGEKMTPFKKNKNRLQILYNFGFQHHGVACFLKMSDTNTLSAMFTAETLDGIKNDDNGDDDDDETFSFPNIIDLTRSTLQFKRRDCVRWINNNLQMLIGIRMEFDSFEISDW